MASWPSELRVTARDRERLRRELEATPAAARSAGDAPARHAELFDLAPIACIDIGVDARVRAHNQAASQLLGLGSSQLCERAFRSLVAPNQRDGFDTFLAALRLRREPGSAEFVLLRAGKSRFDAQLVARLLSGREPSILIAIEDITERKARDAELARAQQALRDADRHKDEFLALLSHELRNPLTPLANCLSVLSHSEPGSERAHAARSIMQRQLDQLTRLTEDLLDVTRIARGKMRLQRERVDWHERLEHALEDHRASFDACGVELDGEAQPGPCWVHADPARLTQAMSNLIGNALKFTPRGGRVAVRLERDAGRALLRVSDTGAGIDAESLPRVFEPFAQAPQTLDRSPRGLGLGLAMVKGLVELHGGSVSVSSAGPGLGTELSVWLPLDASDEHALTA